MIRIGNFFINSFYDKVLLNEHYVNYLVIWYVHVVSTVCKAVLNLCKMFKFYFVNTFQSHLKILHLDCFIKCKILVNAF